MANVVREKGLDEICQKQGVEGGIVREKENRARIEFVLNFFRDFKAATGQQLWLLNSKMSTNSPDGHQFFGILMWIITELSRKDM